MTVELVLKLYNYVNGMYFLKTCHNEYVPMDRTLYDPILSDSNFQIIVLQYEFNHNMFVDKRAHVHVCG
jgi:hypothetical protein